MRRLHRLLLLPAALLFSLPGGASGPAGPSPAAAPGTPAGDAHYERVLRAYRAEATAEELAALEEEDPGPALFLGPNTPGERGVARLFAALPDPEHARLKQASYLKWPLAALPADQRRLLQVKLSQLELRGEGPFPGGGGDAAVTGFAAVRVEEGELPQYCWWIHSRAARRPAWLTLVRLRRTGTPEYERAHRERLAEVAQLADSPAVPRDRWLKLRPPPAAPASTPEPKREPLVEEKYYWSAVRAYRGRAGREDLAALGTRDPLVARRLRGDASDRGVGEFFGRLPDAEHRKLLDTGRLTWTPRQLSRDQLRRLGPVVERLNRQALDGGGAGGPYDLTPFGGTTVGLAVVFVPEVEGPAVSWWIRSAAAPVPAWVTLLNDAALKAPLYYRVHLEQLGRIQ